jgi:hypothetical protein
MNSPLNLIDPFGLCGSSASKSGKAINYCPEQGGNGSAGFGWDEFDILQLALTPTGPPQPVFNGDTVTWVTPYGNIGLLSLLGAPPSTGGGGGNTSGPDGPQKPTVKATPTLKFKPPSWQNFTHEFLPCYGGQLLGNLLTGDGAVGTVGTVALTVAKPLIGGPLLLVWTGINAFQAGAACAFASRAVYQ